MKAIWNGLAPTLGASTSYAFITNVLSGPWSGTEFSTGGFGMRTAALSDAIVITKLSVYISTAPGVGTGWTFTVRKNQANSPVAVTISGTNTSATWTGSASFSQLDLICMCASVSAGSPANTGVVYWTIEYNSVGSDYYVVPGSIGGYQNLTQYWNPFGGQAASYSLTATEFQVVVPTSCTVTKIAGLFSQTQAAGTANNFFVRKNDTTDSSFSAVISTTGSSAAVSSTGSMSFAAGDRMVIKMTPTGNPPWAALASCITIVPGSTGEVISAFGNLASPQQPTSYEAPLGMGANAAWSTTETTAYMRVAACTMKNLYVLLATASGAGTSWTATLRSNSADTAITTTLSNVTTGNDTTHTANQNDGDFVSIKMAATGSPAGTAVSASFVQLVAQAGNFFPMF